MEHVAIFPKKPRNSYFQFFEDKKPEILILMEKYKLTYHKAAIKLW